MPFSLATGTFTPPRPLHGASARLALTRHEARWDWPDSAEATKSFGATAPSSWRARTSHASARWLWRVRSPALGAFERYSGRVARSYAPDVAPARAHFQAFGPPIFLARPRSSSGA
ncbi:hypothetical protein PIB30_061959 [Stylosanthes scabra]|uniref:Uncharacterized protein n=1 Tax=Stylosanthes scabra TaxID=79078 RepID=A0ABU6ZJS6_9FABA|nr:hypothetical protein [Stylosanthes scabra]